MSVDVQVEVNVDRPVADVASFAGDPGNAPQWYANITSVSGRPRLLSLSARERSSWRTSWAAP